jgi:hypothetical protein
LFDIKVALKLDVKSFLADIDRYAYNQITSEKPVYDGITSVMTKTDKGKLIAK